MPFCIMSYFGRCLQVWLQHGVKTFSEKEVVVPNESKSNFKATLTLIYNWNGRCEIDETYNLVSTPSGKYVFLQTVPGGKRPSGSRFVDCVILFKRNIITQYGVIVSPIWSVLGGYVLFTNRFLVSIFIFVIVQ